MMQSVFKPIVREILQCNYHILFSPPPLTATYVQLCICLSFSLPPFHLIYSDPERPNQFPIVDHDNSMSISIKNGLICIWTF